MPSIPTDGIDPLVPASGQGEVVNIVTSQTEHESRLARRDFFALAARRGLQIGLAGMSLPALLAACSSDDASSGALATSTPTATGGPREAKIVGDVTDYALTGDWQGAFGFVTFRLQRGVFNGTDVYFIRTDASDEAFAKSESLVWVPRIAGLAAQGPAADAYLIAGGVADQATVMSTEPGRSDYTPAWRIHRASWKGSPTKLNSVSEVKTAESGGNLTVEKTNIILNGPVVKWSTGEMTVDNERKVYLGPGQLLEKPDTKNLTVMFKLHECFPGVRYIVTDVALGPMADGMKVVHSPKLAGASKAGATGRTNVFMNGMKGSGPMGFQASVFDSQAGAPAWSPYWDHMTYAWKEGKTPRILRDEASVHAARDGGELDEFAGTPDTKGATFVVNCPVPVLAPNTV